MSKKEKLKDFYRSVILEAAQSLFAAKGFVHTTMDDIVEKSELSKTTIYACFNSKEEIYSSILLQNMKLLTSTLESAVQNKPFKEAYMAICFTHVEFQEQQPLFLESLLNFSSEPEAEANPIQQEIARANVVLNEFIAGFLHQGIADKIIKPDIDVMAAGFTIWAGICGLIMMASHKATTIDCLGISKKEFLEYGFNTYLEAILL